MPTEVKITNWEEYWQCEHERENEKNLWSGILLLFLNGYLISEYLSKYKNSQERLQSIARRNQSMAVRLKDHYILVDHPQKIFALEQALSIPLPTIDVACVDFDKSGLVKAMSGQKDLLIDRYDSCGDYGCDNSIEISGSLAMTDTSYSRIQFNRRRHERRLEFKRRMVQVAHSSTLQAPSGIFQLMNGAAEIYSTIFQNAQKNLAGAVGGFGYGLKLLT